MLALKAFGRWITFFVFHMGILFFITTVSLMLMLGDRQNVKLVLLEAGVYENFVDAFLETAQEESGNAANSLPYGDVEFQKIANEAFTPASIQTGVEGAIDSVYDWVDGSKEELSFEINLEREAEIFISDISNYAVERYSELPQCTLQDTVNVTIFDLTCQPVGATEEIIREAARADLSQTDFIKDPVISSENLFGTEDQTPEEQFSFLPNAYNLARITPYFASVLILIAGILFIFLHRSKRRGVKRLGRDMVTNAAFIFLLTIVFGFILPRYTDTFSVQGTGLPRMLNSVIDGFLQQLDTIVINISLVLGSIGLSLLAIEKMSRPENLYAGIEKKTGLSSSVPKKSKKTTPKNSKKPPVQTSEVKKKKGSRRKKSSKYRKIGL